MKKILGITLTVIALAMMTSCGKTDKNGFKTTDSGLKYKFIESNSGAQQVQKGDVLVATCTLRLEDSILAKQETPDRILAAQEQYPGDVLPEGLMMMHIGDHAIFAIDADKVFTSGRAPSYFKPGTGMKLYYDVVLTDIVTKSMLEQEMQNYYEGMSKRAEEEKEMLAQYATEHNIKATPNEEGLYIYVKKQGKGPKVEIGKEVAVNYTGRLLDGKVFDTSLEPVAKANDMYNPQRPYEPLTYRVGQQAMIRGWDAGVINQAEGTQLVLLMPSALGYGPQDNGPIPANSPLVFELEIVSVK